MPKITHGLTKHPLYQVWATIKQRCSNPNNPRYKDYGGRGITICDEWKRSFELFYEWATTHGWEYGLTTDRTDNNGNYEPENCRFVTHRENILNKRLIRSNNTSGYRGVSWDKNDKKWAPSIGINGKLISLKRQDTVEEAVLERNSYIVEKNLSSEYEVQLIKSIP